MVVNKTGFDEIDSCGCSQDGFLWVFTRWIPVVADDGFLWVLTTWIPVGVDGFDSCGC